MRIVDVHAHFYPKDYLEMLRRIVANDSTPWGRHNAMALAGNIGGTPAMWEIEAHIDDMDAAGVEVQALSLSHPQAYLGEEQVAVEAARITNDSLADVCARYPTRFKGLASLPLPHAEPALRELERAINILGLHGVALGANVRDIPLDDDRFLPIYREIDRLGLTIFLHPMTPPGYEELKDYNLSTAAGFLMDSAVAVLRLANRGVFEENPNLNLIVPHLGSYLLSAFERVGGGQTPRPVDSGARQRQARRPARDYLLGLYYDCVNPHLPFWKCAIETVGSDHIVFGTDYPFGTRDTIQAYVRRVESLDLATEEREAIFSGTADRILR